MTPHRRWAAASVLGPVLFVVGFTVLGVDRAGYDPMRHFVSLLSLTGDGWPKSANCGASGLLIVLGAIGLRSALIEGPGYRVIPIAVGLTGIALVVAGLVPTDPVQGYPPGTPLEMPDSISPNALVHVSAALVLFAALTVAGVVGARRFQVRGQSGLAAYSLASAIVVLISNAVTSTPPGTISPVAPIAGLLQRIALIAGLGWVAWFSLRTLRSRRD